MESFRPFVEDFEKFSDVKWSLLLMKRALRE